MKRAVILLFTACLALGAPAAAKKKLVLAPVGTSTNIADFLPPPITADNTWNLDLSDGGRVVIQLRPDKAPLMVARVKELSRQGFYNGLIFHRYSPGFVVQGGGYGPSTNGLLPPPKPASAPINYEAGGGSNLQWTVAMARTQALNSATSQFFINMADNSLLDAAPYGPYAVFASVDAGSVPLVQSITSAPCVLDPTDLPAGDCLPAPNIVITSATQTQ